MAKVSGVWGIDIGDCALKALRCLPDNTTGRVRAEAFDYIEYPKILSQPEANREELVAEAINTFLSRNDVRDDQVAINVPGQNGLSRFIKLPPVESKKIPDIVKYEARQQIPFDLNDVVWDFQKMAGGSESEGFALETEVGLFAMKRDQAYKQLRPFTNAKIDVDYIQLAPLALYNYVVADQMPRLPDDDSFDPDNPPESILVLSVGTETTDLVITNGFRVWQRSIPVGGSNFTKALSKELRQTFAKAEHLKRNATQAENPKALFQAMRPVFTDLVTEVQRSLTFFGNIDKKAKITRGVALGGGAKLPGLVRFLEQNLNIPMERVDTFHTLTGAGVVDTPTFKDHTPSFGICYGLCLQGLDESKLKTNLIPAEIIHDRMIEAKKPWAVAAVAVLMLGLGISFFGNWYAWNLTRPDYGNRASAEQQATTTVNSFTKERNDFQQGKQDFENIDNVGEIFVQNQFRRRNWPDVLAAVAAATVAPQEVIDAVPEEHKDLPDGLKVEAIFTQPSTYEEFKAKIETSIDGGASPKKRTDDYLPPDLVEPETPEDNFDPGAPPAAPATSAPMGYAASQAARAGSSGQEEVGTKGYVISVQGYHDHNPELAGDVAVGGDSYLARTLIANLRRKAKEDHPGFEIRDPVITERALPAEVKIPNPEYNAADPEARDLPKQLTRRRFFFVVEMFVIPKQVVDRDGSDTSVAGIPSGTPGGE